VNDLVVAESFSTKAACDSVGMARSTYYYRSRARDESQIGIELEQVAGQYPKYGTRRMTHQLRRAPYFYRINRKHVQRLMREKKLLRPVKRTKYRTTNSPHPYPRYLNLMKDMEVVRPEQAWGSEIVFTQMTKTCVLPIWTGGEHVANFDFIVGHNHTIN
jgi:putative transposase